MFTTEDQYNKEGSNEKFLLDWAVSKVSEGADHRLPEDYLIPPPKESKGYQYYLESYRRGDDYRRANAFYHLPGVRGEAKERLRSSLLAYMSTHSRKSKDAPNELKASDLLCDKRTKNAWVKLPGGLNYQTYLPFHEVYGPSETGGNFKALGKLNLIVAPLELLGSLSLLGSFDLRLLWSLPFVVDFIEVAKDLNLPSIQKIEIDLAGEVLFEIVDLKGYSTPKIVNRRIRFFDRLTRVINDYGLVRPYGDISYRHMEINQNLSGLPSLLVPMYDNSRLSNYDSAVFDSAYNNFFRAVLYKKRVTNLGYPALASKVLSNGVVMATYPSQLPEFN